MAHDAWSIDPGHGVGELTLGTSRDETLRSLAERSIAFEEQESESGVYVDDLEAELHFDESAGLVEIEIESERLTLGGQPVIGQRIHDIVDRVGAREEDTAWTWEIPGSVGKPYAFTVLDRQAFDGLTSPRDEDLFSNGTLWIPRAGLGFALWRGEVMVVHVRRAGDVSTPSIGTFTESQRTLSQRPDLPEFLAAAESAVRLPNLDVRLPKVSWSARSWTLMMVAALGLLVWRAIDYQSRWNAAPVVEGTVVAVDPPPPDPFPSKFTVAYQDLEGNPHETVFGFADVYVTRAVGDKVEVRYLPGAPDEPMGPARVSDAAFLKFMPWGIAIVGVYLGVQILAWIAAAVWRATQSAGARPEELKTTIGKEYD